MGEFGTRFREAREQQGLSLAQAEETTRIRRVFLQALEEEHYEELPPPIYARGFVRLYARFLGLDPEAMVDAFQEATGKPVFARAPLVLDEPLMRRHPRHAWTGIFRGFVIVIFIALIGWYAYSRFYLGVDPWPMEITLPEWWPIGSMLFAPTSTPTAVPTVVLQTVRATPTSEVQTVFPTAAERETVAEVPTSLPTATATTVTVEPTRTRIPLASPTPTLVSGIRVEGEALAETYVAVTSDGTATFEEMLAAAQTRVWTAKRAISLRVGNAAGLKLTVNGVAVAPLGGSGEVVTVQYTLDTLPKP